MMESVRVKICGITRPSDALLAAELGASYVGFVFAQSPRKVDPLLAGDIVSLLPKSVVPVGVFVDAPRDEVLDVVSQSGIRLLQFHGDETPEYCASFGAFPTMNAFRVREGFDAAEMERYPCRTFLLDAYHPTRHGGTGETFDWSLAVEPAKRFRTMLAGGLTPENVVDAVDAVHPYGIDVSSGVEASPGVKDPEKLTKLFRELEWAQYHTLPGGRSLL